MGLGEKKQVVRCYILQGLNSRRAIAAAGLTKHQYYHKPSQGKRGRKPSTQTVKLQGDSFVICDNSDVIAQIKAIKSDPDLTYGYQKTTAALQQTGYIINDKKVYRIMKVNGLLEDKVKFKNKPYVQFQKVLPNGPLEVLEMDIKMKWVERERRQAYILNVVDTFTRQWLYHDVSFSITAKEVQKAWMHIIEHHLQPADCLNRGIHIEIRNDNDKRFSAQIVQDFFKENKLGQVFTHPYTPQENAHIESFHGILSKHLQQRIFWSLAELQQDLILFMDTYNNHRIHRSVAFLQPNIFAHLWYQNLISTTRDEKKRQIKFKLLIQRQLIISYSGNDEPEGFLSHDLSPLDGAINQPIKKIDGAILSKILRSNVSPSGISRNTKLITNHLPLQNQN
jgi:transposase InsO family protein